MLECYWMPLVDTAFVQLALNNYEKLSKKLKRIWLNVNVCVNLMPYRLVKPIVQHMLHVTFYMSFVHENELSIEKMQ